VIAGSQQMKRPHANNTRAISPQGAPWASDMMEDVDHHHIREHFIAKQQTLRVADEVISVL
jgi:hypothetical protein